MTTITLKKANKKLEFDSLLKKRKQSRIFGNIDCEINELNTTDIFGLVWEDMDMNNKLKKAFERDDKFYSYLKNK